MGNTRSIIVEESDYWWPNANAVEQTMEKHQVNVIESADDNIVQDVHDEFEQKRESRRQILAAKKLEMQALRSDLQRFTKENDDLRMKLTILTKNPVTYKKCETCEASKLTMDQLSEENAQLKMSNDTLMEEVEQVGQLRSKNRELNITLSEIQTELQRMNTELLSIEKERQEYQNHIKAQKDVIRLTKEMVQIREEQINDLNTKIKTIEEILASKEMRIMSNDLREEYERQLRNIRNLRSLYEVRQRVDRREREQLESNFAEQKAFYETEQAKVAAHEATIEEQQQDISKKYDTIASLESNLGLSNAECRDLKSEINAINQVFSQILLSFKNSQNLDFDKLIKDLQDNHDLLANIIVTEQSPEISASQTKVLLDLINQSEDATNPSSDDLSEVQIPPEKIDGALRRLTTLQTIPEETEPNASPHQLNSAEQIVENLPKVWKVLIELLSQQNPPCNISEGDNSTETTCYKSVQTPNGPKLVLSVSQTFIRLKDLILEKKSLEKEMGRLKNLNGHLEGRLQEQEKRLHLVSGELSKTWHVVGKMQKQHEQLHTQERILRYELAHKRKMLTNIKQELEFCREKWAQAREKNTETEVQWKQLRSEFAARKVKPDNYSGESGYSDDKSSSDEDVDIKSEKEDEAGVENTEDSEEAQIAIITEIAEPLSNEDINKTIEDSLEFTSISDPKTDCVEKEYLSREKAETLEVTKPSTEENRNKPDDSLDSTSTPSAELKTDHECLEKEYLPREKTVTTEPLANEDTNKTSEDSLESTSTPNQNSSDCLKKDDLPREDLVTIERINSTEVQNSLSSTTEDTTPNMVTSSEDEGEFSILNQNIIFAETTTASNTGEVGSDTASVSQSGPSSPRPSLEDILQRREARMQRLEEQCKSLVSKVTKTNVKSNEISDKLDNLHDAYGEQTETLENIEAAPAPTNFEENDDVSTDVIQDNVVFSDTVEP